METASYNRYSRWLHWLTAGLIVFTIILGWRNETHDAFRLTRITLHKSIGITILLLTFLRVGLRLAYKAPPEPPMPRWQALAAKGLHFGFYIVMVAMPLTGWLMVSTSVRPIPFFGLFEVPHLPFVPIEAGHGPVHELFETIHKLIAKVLIYGMIPLHVLAALKHQFVDKDEVIQHMVPGLKPEPVVNWRWLIPLGVVGLAVALGYGIYRGVPEKGGEQGPEAQEEAHETMSMSASIEPVAPVAAAVAAPASEAASASVSASAQAAAVTVWTVDKSATKIAFSTTFEGEGINGGFSGYAANIAFDPEQLDKSHVKVTIDLASVGSGDKDRDDTLRSNSFFNVSVTPKAVFEAKSFTKKDATHFIAHGKLTLHGVTKAQELPFTLTIKDGVAQMNGATSLDRTAFGVGSGDYAATDTIPAAVKIDITLKAKAATKAAQ